MKPDKVEGNENNDVYSIEIYKGIEIHALCNKKGGIFTAAILIWFAYIIHLVAIKGHVYGNHTH